MIGQYLITFREVLEAALITSIIAAYFLRTNRYHLMRHVWLGIGIAVLTSISIAVIVSIFYGGLSEAGAKLFEGVAALIAVAVLTTMIIWMAIKGKNIREDIDEDLSQTVKKGTALGLVGFSFIVVFREAFETVLFLIPFGASDPAGTIAGAVLGLISALIISLLIFRVGVKIDLGKFFFFTSILLILLAAGLFGYGVHEIISYQKATGTEIGWLGQYAYELDISKDSIWYHKGALGSIFAVMFGYSVKMEWARIIVHIAYLLIFLPLTIVAYTKPHYLDRAVDFIMRVKNISNGS